MGRETCNGHWKLTGQVKSQPKKAVSKLVQETTHFKKRFSWFFFSKEKFWAKRWNLFGDLTLLSNVKVQSVTKPFTKDLTPLETQNIRVKPPVLGKHLVLETQRKIWYICYITVKRFARVGFGWPNVLLEWFALSSQHLERNFVSFRIRRGYHSRWCRQTS